MSKIDEAIIKLMATVFVIIITAALIWLGIDSMNEQERMANQANELIRGKDPWVKSR